MKNKTAQQWIDESVDNEGRYMALFYPKRFQQDLADQNLTKVIKGLK